jgi:hypothetical protein
MKRMCLVVLGAAEIFARTYLGLGTPPLSVPHPTIEYMFKPNQDVRRFGNRQFYNEYGMRSAPLPDARRTEIVLVIGDSVINGGNLTDQADLATTIATLNDAGRFYANISAGSWGPGNQLAYLKEFGTFGADAAILVLNTGDLDDLPRFGPIDPTTHPLESPLTALGEGIVRYLPRYLPDTMSGWLRPGLIQHPFSQTAAEISGENYLNGLFSYFAEASLPVCVVLHSGLDEQSEQSPTAGAGIKKLATKAGVPIVETLPVFGQNSRDPAQFYLDNIHINSNGQAIFVDVLKQCLKQARIPNNIFLE